MRQGQDITFLIVSISNSARLWQQHREAMAEAEVNYQSAIRRIIEEQDGDLFQTVNDSFYTAFVDANSALEAAVAIQRLFHTAAWPVPLGQLQVRTALHSGAAEIAEGAYRASVTLNRLSRIHAAGHASQILLSADSAKRLGTALPQGTQLRDLGERRLRDVPQPIHLYQFLIPDLPQDFPPLKTLDQRSNNLPALPTSFVGREQDIAILDQLLRQPDVRLVTLTGPGGTGKTRLSLEVAADLLDEYEHGVFFVPLAPITDPALVASAIAHRLGLHEEGGMEIVETLKKYLADKQMLLVLDNFEQVVAAANLVGEMLDAAPRLKLIVSSRELLHLAAEHEYAVPPFALPDLAALPSLEQVAEHAAVKLFVQRAQAVRLDFALTAANAPAIVGICVRLEGLPLAIELAAARSRELDPAQILEQLRDRLSLLVGGWRNLPPRQRSLRGAIEWSYDLLNGQERLLFRRLAVFVGGWDEQAATQVCSDEGIAEAEVLPLLVQLADKSLVQTQAQGEETRYMMLDTIREYALLAQAEAQTEVTRYMMQQAVREYAQEQLNRHGGVMVLRQRHAEYYLALAEQAESQLSSAEQATWLLRLEAEKNNISAALTWLKEQEQTETLLRLAAAMWRFWYVRGYLHEGRDWLEAALAMGQVSSLRAKALIGVTAIASTQGDNQAASRFIAESLAVARQMGDQQGIANALNGMGIIAISEGHNLKAREILTEALEISRKANNPRRTASIANNLAVAIEGMGDLENAIAIYQEALAIQRGLGNHESIALILNNLGEISSKQGRFDLAQDYLNEAWRVCKDSGSKETIGGIINNMGRVAELKGDIDTAQALYEQGLTLFEEESDEQGIARQLCDLANLARIRGNFGAARKLYQQSMIMAVKSNLRGDIPRFLEGLAQLVASEAQFKVAARLLGAAASWRETVAKPLVGIQGEPIDALTSQLTAQLGSSFAAIFAEGRDMSEEQKIQYMLGQLN